MSWENVLGHEPVIRLLKGQLRQGHPAPTYLFVGLKGIGKQTLALEFAKALECEAGGLSGEASSGRSHEAGGAQACDQCEVCRKISQNSFPDVKRMVPGSETGQMGIDQVRELAHWMALTPYSGRWKVGIVEEAHTLTDQAAHACLKFLEEPPQRSILIFIATATHRLPATLVSRLSLVRCVPQGIEPVARFLREKERLDPVLSTMLATWSGGRVGIALESHRKQRLATKNAALDQLLKAWRQGVLEIPLGNAPRQELEEALEWVAAWWRDLIILSLKGDPTWVIHQDRLEDLKESFTLSRRPSPSTSSGRTAGESKGEVEALLALIERTYRVEEAIQRNASPRIALAALLCN